MNMTIERLERVNVYDFQNIDLEDWETDQDFHLLNAAKLADAVAGSGVLLDFPEEKVIFDSDELDSFQQGLVAIDTFDGQGILSEPYTITDSVGGSQIALTITDARLDGFLKTLVFILGKTFDSELIYEVVEIGNNLTEITKNHFIEVTNILFQNFRGNVNTTVDGYGCFNVGGRILITEASSMRCTRDPIIDQQIVKPDIFFRNFKVANPGQTLQVMLENAIGSSNDVDDLDVNTTVANSRTFEEDGSTETIYAQKFKMNGNNIQKITLILSLESGSEWSGSLILGLRALQTSETSTSDFLPDYDIGFDPSTEPIEEIAVDQDDLEDMGIILGPDPQMVDFVFTGSNISNPSLSNLIEGNFYAITLRRSGSSAIGTIVLEEATNDDPTLRRLSVFESSVWTDVEDSTLWYRVWGDAARATSGVAYDQGIRLATPKTIIDNNGVQVQNFTEDYDFANTGEDVENYVIIQKSEEETTPEAHPRTGDEIYSRVEDVPLFSILEQDDLETLINAGSEPVVLARLRDRNPRSNPTITGTIDYPGLVLGNIITIIDPGSDLLTQNVVGSIITPNITKPNLRYRIISQTTYEDLYGDTNSDSQIDVDDAARIAALDGYATDLNGGSYSTAIQLAAVRGGSISVPELLRADVTGNGLITSADLDQVNDFIEVGTAFTAGSSFVRMELAVEPLTDPHTVLNEDAESTLNLEDADGDFINNASFSPISYSIEFIATWEPENIEVVDLRRYITTTFLDFDANDLSSTPESGGNNSLFIPGDVYLTGSVKDLDGSFHALDYETNVIEIELPEGDTDGELNIFDTYVVDSMKFSDGSFVSSSAINDNQIKFSLSISSYVKDLGDGYEFNDGYGVTADEQVGTYLDHDTGLLRLTCKNIVYSSLYPEARTRITITVGLKKAGFANSPVFIDPTDLAAVLI